eukprot:Nk52_evm18s2241 gene=Nk52_evmTU18s2241
MRPLTEEETKLVLEKLTKYIGANVALLIERSDGEYCFRLHKDRVYYVREDIMRKATNVARENLHGLGCCIGKLTHSGKFRLQVTALPILAQYAKYKIWVKPSGEQSYLYGNHITKSQLGRITENTDQYQGVVIYNMADVPLGFGVAAKGTAECRKCDPNTIIAFHQSDTGEYLRQEELLS